MRIFVKLLLSGDLHQNEDTTRSCPDRVAGQEGNETGHNLHKNENYAQSTCPLQTQIEVLESGEWPSGAASSIRSFQLCD